MEDQLTMGWSMIVLIGILIVVNLTLVIYFGVKANTLLIVKYYRIGRHHFFEFLIKHGMKERPNLPKTDISSLDQKDQNQDSELEVDKEI